jgi:hypothetical protein
VFSRLATLFAVLGLAIFMLVSCGKKNAAEDGHDHKHEKGEASGGHGHGEESPGGASFKAGKGVILTDETRQSLGAETAEVTEHKLPLELRFAVQVFGEDHKPTAIETEHAECTGKASGLLPQKQAALLRPGQPVALMSKSGEKLGGIVLGLNKALAIGDAEVVVGITNAGARLKPAEFLSAVITLPRADAVTVVPKSALLRTADGTFVYTVNGDAYFRTAVKTGAEAEGFVEITDGLLNGDAVVTKPVEKLWLIELRATKGGGHSH